MNIHIYYGSTRGNTHIVVSHLQNLFQQQWHTVELLSVVSQRTIDPADAYIFACGTYGHGVLQENMTKFLYKYNPKIDLENEPCAAIGLGDDKYDTEYNIESAVILSEFIQSHNGDEIVESLRINKSPLPHLHKKIQVWGEEFVEKLTKNHE